VLLLAVFFNLVTATFAASNVDTCQVHTTFPQQDYRPEEAIKRFGVVFYGTVSAPSRKCNLGYCAGLTITRPIQGIKSGTAVVATQAPCAFKDSNKQWLVFANAKKTGKGLRYFVVPKDSPTFQADKVETIEGMSREYRRYEAKLDFYIEQSLKDRR
jgi:hypothetical protein